MSSYDQCTRQAEKLRNNLKDFLDQPNDAHARQVMQQVEGLVSDLKQKKSREAIDNRLKIIIGNLDRVDGEVMDFHHSDQLKGTCEDLRSAAAKL